jgi:GT2 family glycosyltransferase
MKGIFENSANTVPIIIVPILTRPDILIDMIKSIDYKVKKILVIDNGNNCRGLDVNNPFVKEIKVISLDHNLGVPGSWNLGIKANPFEKYWTFVNFDVTFVPGALREMNLESDRKKLTLSNATPPWCFFSIGAEVVKKVGLFDEKFVPAYFEDVDYERRCIHYQVEINRTRIFVNHNNSSTIKNGFEQKNNRTFVENSKYMQDKIEKGDFSEGGWSLNRRLNLSWD